MCGALQTSISGRDKWFWNGGLAKSFTATRFTVPNSAYASKSLALIGEINPSF